MLHSDFNDWLIDEMRFSPSTVKATIRKLAYIERNCNIEDRESIQEFIRRTWQEKSNRTANGYIKIVNRYLKFQRKKPLNYFKEYESFTVKFCSEDQKYKLLYAADKTGPREGCMFYLLFGTGLRLQEACDLKLQDIFEDTIRVRGKGQKKREIYLPPEAALRIRKYLDFRQNTDREYLFTTEKGRMSYDYFRARCQIVALKAGVKFHPHMARHTYATELLKGGMNIFYVSRLLGHQDLSSTQIYLHPSQNDAIAQAKKINLFQVRIPEELNSMDRRGFEPRASSMPRKRSTSDLPAPSLKEDIGQYYKLMLFSYISTSFQILEPLIHFEFTKEA